MKLRFLSIAETELDDAIAFYEDKESGLGLLFLSEIKNTVDRILAFPEAWHQLSQHTRRCLTTVFPYGIIDQVRQEEILIIAIASLHRAPHYWKDRT